MESSPDSSVHVYTMLIIVFLVLSVLGWILSTLDATLAEENENSNQRFVLIVVVINILESDLVW